MEEELFELLSWNRLLFIGKQHGKVQESFCQACQKATQEWNQTREKQPVWNSYKQEKAWHSWKKSQTWQRFTWNITIKSYKEGDFRTKKGPKVKRFLKGAEMHMQVLPGFKVFGTLCLIVCVGLENKLLTCFGYFWLFCRGKRHCW